MFYITKPSCVTNIHRKFEEFFPSGFEFIKVLHISNRSKDGVTVSQTIIKESFHKKIRKKKSGDKKRAIKKNNNMKYELGPKSNKKLH